jgi:hypothetical protein
MFPTLTSAILKKQTVETLWKYYSETPLIDIEIEIANRLLSPDKSEVIDIISFIHKKWTEKDKTINMWLEPGYILTALYEMRNKIGWKIGVIYDYRDMTDKINNVIIRVGIKPPPYKTKTGQYFKANRTYSNYRKLVKREVISLYSHPVNTIISIVTTNPELDSIIRDILIKNNSAIISLCKYLAGDGINIRSYPNDPTLDQRELKQIYPCYISSKDFSHNLIVLPPNVNFKHYNVPIEKSPEVNMLVDLIGK